MSHGFELAPWGCHPHGGDLAGVTVAFGGLSLEAALEDRELLPETARAPQVGSLLCRQQLLHLPHHAERLLLAQALLGGHKDIPVTRWTPPPPRCSPGDPPKQAASLGLVWMPCPGQSPFLPIPGRGLSLPPYLLQPQPLRLVLPRHLDAEEQLRCHGWV